MRRRIGFENSKIQKKRRKEIQGVGMGPGAYNPPLHPGSGSAPDWAPHGMAPPGCLPLTVGRLA